MQYAAAVSVNSANACLHCNLQIFHTMYHTDENVLLGAPTGSGKTISAELAVLRCFAAHPGQKIIYVAPLKVCDPTTVQCPPAINTMTPHSPRGQA